MPASMGPDAEARLGRRKPSEDFASYCEAEFERRLNSGQPFDEPRYRKAMGMVLSRLIQLEQGGQT